MNAEPPEFDAAALPAFDPLEFDDVAVEAALACLPHLPDDLRYDEPDTVERIYKTEKCRTAAATLGFIPTARQAVHLVINGRFALWDFVPALITLSGLTIAQVHLATLGFSRKNIAELCLMLDAATIKNAALLCSHYFKGTSGGIFETAEEQLAARSQRFASCRTHAKVIVVKLSDGRTVSLESSANLRSCHNIEQVYVTGDPGLYQFHVDWIESLFPKPARQ